MDKVPKDFVATTMSMAHKQAVTGLERRTRIKALVASLMVDAEKLFPS
jgi:hypothetical protein